MTNQKNEPATAYEKAVQLGNEAQLTDFTKFSDDDLIKAAHELKSRGFAVVVFTPDELSNTDPDQIEEIMVERGWNMIQEHYVDDEEPEEESPSA